MSKLDKFKWALHGDQAAVLLSELIGERVTPDDLGKLCGSGVLPARYLFNYELFKVNPDGETADLNQPPVFTGNEVLLSCNCSLINDVIALTLADQSGLYVAVERGEKEPLDFFDPRLDLFNMALFDTADIYRVAEEANSPGPLASHSFRPASQTVFRIADGEPVILHADAAREGTGGDAPGEPAKAREQTGSLLAIAGLLELLLENDRPRYTQGRAAEEIEHRHGWYGASVSNLTKLFAAANAAAADADKAAQFRQDTLKPRTR